MKIISAIIFLSVFVNATDYFAKLEPLETYNIKSAVSGQVIFTNDNIEGSISHNSIIVTIDSEIDKIDFKQTTNKLKTLTKIITIEKSTLKKFKNIRSKSQLDKDNQQIKILNLENQQSDMIVKLASLKDKISKKELKEKNHYISNINVQAGDFVNPGSLLYTASNISKSKLEIFLPINSTIDYMNKKIYIDDKITSYKISKLYKVADLKHISSYKCEIIIDSPKNFSSLAKVTFK